MAVGKFLPNKTATVFISTGELSGEMHAAHLVTRLQEFRKQNGQPPVIMEGNGAEAMVAAGVTLLHDVATWSEMGILANMAKAQFFHKVVMGTLRHILSNQPDLVILVDNRFLNTNLARLLRQNGYGGKIVYYVAPVRWESCFDPAEHAKSLQNKRFLDIKRYCDFAIPIYPVSLKVYEELDIPHGFYGHPLCDLAKPSLDDASFEELVGYKLGPLKQSTLVGVLPGSRVGEIREIAPEMFKGLALVEEAFSEADDLPKLQVVVALAHPSLRDEVISAAKQAGLGEMAMVEAKYSWDLMARARMMLVKSGTGLHQCMLMGVPSMMCYKVAPATAMFARMLRFSMPYYGLPNLLANKPIVPELIQEDCTGSRIAEMAGGLLFDEDERKTMLEGFAEVRQLVCKPDPLGEIAKKVSSFLGN